MNVLVTGGAGFIGSHLVLDLVLKQKMNVLNIDKLSYGSNLNYLKPCKENYQFLKQDIIDKTAMQSIFHEFKPNLVLHLAAESHVDRSIENPDDFLKSNVEGTVSLLKAALDYWDKSKNPSDFRFVHVSTDEVYGCLGLEDPAFTEESQYLPNSPYSASKAASDLFARSWHKTYGLPTMITHCSNNYGPHQFFEKLIPLMIHNALTGKDLPVYGNGMNIRDWLYVSDHISGLMLAAENGKPGETYNFGGGYECSNIDIVNKICTILDELKPRADGAPYSNQICFVTDRKGHDFRYAVNTAKAEKELGWKAKTEFKQGLVQTIRWYIQQFS